MPKTCTFAYQKSEIMEIQFYYRNKLHRAYPVRGTQYSRLFECAKLEGAISSATPSMQMIIRDRIDYLMSNYLVNEI